MMRTVRVIAAMGMLAASFWLFAGAASADPYTGPPGQTPNAGAVETGVASPTRVLGQSFTRTENGGFLASTGADIAELVLFAAACVGVGVVLVRRARPRRSSPRN